MCKACNKSCASDTTHICDQTCSDCIARPPCVFSAVKIHCAECNRHFSSQACLANHKQSTSNKKSVCERKRCCSTCGVLKRSNKHECNKRFCEICKQNSEVGHLCYMRPLRDVLPANPDKVLYVFYDFETTQNKRYSDTAKAHCQTRLCSTVLCEV